MTHDPDLPAGVDMRDIFKRGTEYAVREEPEEDEESWLGDD